MPSFQDIIGAIKAAELMQGVKDLPKSYGETYRQVKPMVQGFVEENVTGTPETRQRQRQMNERMMEDVMTGTPGAMESYSQKIQEDAGDWALAATSAPTSVSNPATVGMAKAMSGQRAGEILDEPVTKALAKFHGFDDLTLKSLQALKGSTAVSKQHIINLTNQPGIKQAERDLLRRVADTFDEKIPKPKSTLGDIPTGRQADQALDALSERQYKILSEDWGDNQTKNLLQKIYGSADSAGKEKLLQTTMRKPELKNEMLRAMYENIRINSKSSPELSKYANMSYEEFLETPMTLYRGGNASDPFLDSFTPIKSVADRFSGTDRPLNTITVKPKDTLGSLTAGGWSGEAEVFVPSKNLSDDTYWKVFNEYLQKNPQAQGKYDKLYEQKGIKAVVDKIHNNTPQAPKNKSTPIMGDPPEMLKNTVEAKLSRDVSPYMKELGIKPGENNNQASIYIENYIRTKDPQLHKRFVERAAQSGTPIFEDQNAVSGFIEEQMDLVWESSQEGTAKLDSYVQPANNTKIPVVDFANRVKMELLPLKGVNLGARNESIVLPSNLRGNVANYFDRVYQSPITVGVQKGLPHNYKNQDKYFAHVRIEDMSNGTFTAATNQLTDPNYRPSRQVADDIFKGGQGGNVRRVIEIQSDLLQKGRLEQELIPNIIYQDVDNAVHSLSNYNWDVDRIPEIIKENNLDARAVPAISKRIKGKTEVDIGKRGMHAWNELIRQAQEVGGYEERFAEINQLKPYKNIWHERIIKEEVKQAAVDGKTKLQFPTGETAMKIEGLGNVGLHEEGSFMHIPNGGNHMIRTNPQDLKMGMEVIDRNGSQWIITGVNEEDPGVFKAVSKSLFTGHPEGSIKNFTPDELDEFDDYAEMFNISAKIDKNNPIYKFYEKTIQKYLNRNYNAKKITDDQGVTWFEIDIQPQQSRLPIEAFGAIGAVGAVNEYRNREL